MGIHDRSYMRPGGGGFDGGDFRGSAMRMLNASFPLGVYLDIRVRLHVTFLFVLIYRLTAESGIFDSLRWTALLFLSVLLHEFGHCLACRSVGGQANEILMWPLGGLAMCAPPPRPWAEFVTVVWGPLVNVIIGAAAFVVLLLLFGAEIPVGLNPMHMYVRYPPNALAGLLADVFVVNYALLLFNVVLVFYPFDGGRLVQIGLWPFLGRVRSLRVATAIGMVGAIGLAIFGLTVHSIMLICIAVFGFMACYQQRRSLRGYGPDDAAYEAACLSQSRARAAGGPIASFRAARVERKRRRQAERERRFEQEIDRILEKIHRHGIASLTEIEKKTLARRPGGRRRA
jgi:stage IV sporulation protein FB